MVKPSGTGMSRVVKSVKVQLANDQWGQVDQRMINGPSQWSTGQCSTVNDEKKAQAQSVGHAPNTTRPFPLAQLSPRNFAIILPTRTTPTLMSHSQSTAASSSNPQLVLNNALKAYEKIHEARFTQPSTRLPAPGLQLSRRRSHCPPATSPWARLVPK